MMRSLPWEVALLCLFCVHAKAGTVTFDPASVDAVPGDIITFTVRIASSDLDAFSAADILIASDDLELTGFEYDPGFQDATDVQGTPQPTDPPRFPDGSEIKVGGVAFSGNAITAPLAIGILTVTVPGGIAGGTYQVFVDFDRDNGLSRLTAVGVQDADALFGSVEIGVEGPDGGSATDGGGGSSGSGSAGSDNDNDGLEDNVDTDDDNDGVADVNDAFPNDPQETVDTDVDGLGDNADPDDDGDTVDDDVDAFPMDPAESADTDANGVGNNVDTDDDGDGVSDESDAFPLDPAETTDANNNGLGDNAETEAQANGQSSGSRVGGGLCGAGLFGMIATLFGITAVRVRSQHIFARQGGRS